MAPEGCTDLARSVLPELQNGDENRWPRSPQEVQSKSSYFLSHLLDQWPRSKHRWQDPEVAEGWEVEPWPGEPGAPLPLPLLLAGTPLPRLLVLPLSAGELNLVGVEGLLMDFSDPLLVCLVVTVFTALACSRLLRFRDKKHCASNDKVFSSIADQVRGG